MYFQEQLRATASWDSTVHNTNSLNKITGNNDRVYGIIKVGVTLLHPPGLELVIRKRICLRVYKKMGLGATLMRAFAGRVSTINYNHVSVTPIDAHLVGDQEHVWCHV